MSVSAPHSHDLIPKHILLSEEDKGKILSELVATPDQLPKIRISDPGLAGLEAKLGDVVKIERNDPNGKNIFYRTVIKDK